MNELAVVHLVANSAAPLRRFLTSYDAHESGVPHELYCATNAWSQPFRAEAAEIIGQRGRMLEVNSAAFDLDTYFAVAGQLPHRVLVFLNSYSEILADGWLAKLAGALSDRVGVASATGSYESHLSGYARGAAGAARAAFSIRRIVRGVRTLRRLRRHYDAFPNPHVRTNAFVISRDLFLQIGVPRLHDKEEAERFESGREGLTKSVERRGAEAVVVGRDGVAYGRSRYRESHTFRVGEECNLLVGDNRTREYIDADEPTRRRLRELAWGDSRDFPCARCEVR